MSYPCLQKKLCPFRSQHVCTGTDCVCWGYRLQWHTMITMRILNELNKHLVNLFAKFAAFPDVRDFPNSSLRWVSGQHPWQQHSIPQWQLQELSTGSYFQNRDMNESCFHGACHQLQKERNRLPWFKDVGKFSKVIAKSATRSAEPALESLIFLNRKKIMSTLLVSHFQATTCCHTERA